MVAFGNFGVSGSDVAMQGWLYDVRNTGSPMVLGKQYRDPASPANARLQAHRFADEIIFRLGGGINGIAESKLYFISSRSGHKEVWQMYYDVAAQTQMTHLSSIPSLPPRVSPDSTRLLFSTYANPAFEPPMYSLEVGRSATLSAYS